MSPACRRLLRWLMTAPLDMSTRCAISVEDKASPFSAACSTAWKTEDAVLERSMGSKKPRLSQSHRNSSEASSEKGFSTRLIWMRKLMAFRLIGIKQGACEVFKRLLFKEFSY